ncbi:MAG: hypothetical protein H0V18_09185 [Pyrinomonadaceae bacterium]|nr:hypothetical protein [Pyrinomonadaceae bacterium]
MTADPSIHDAKHFFITNPERGAAIVNIQVEGEELQRFRVNKDHLFAANATTADILLKDYK